MTRVIACIDGLDYSKEVCNAAAWSAQKLAAPLTLLHVIERSKTATAEDFSGAIGLGARSALLKELAELDAQHSKVALEFGKELLSQSQDYIATLGYPQSDASLRHGTLVESLQDLEADARLVIMGRSSQSFKAIGSNIENVIRQVKTPLLIPHQHFSEPQSYLLAYDGRETAEKAVQRILDGQLLAGMTCHLVSVDNNKKGLKENFLRVQQQLIEQGIEVKAEFLSGAIFSSLLQYQRQHSVDLIVMGAFSHSKLASIFLGSNTLKMLEHAQAPLLVLR